MNRREPYRLPGRPVRSKHHSPTPLKVALSVVFIAVAVYVCLAVLLIGGIEEFVHGLQASPDNAEQIAVGLVRFFAAGTVWSAAVVVLIVAWIP